MSPWAEPHHNKLVYALGLMCIVVTIPFAIALYYYRSRSQEVRASGGDEIAIKTLAQAGAVSVQHKAAVSAKPVPRQRSAK